MPVSRNTAGMIYKYAIWEIFEKINSNYFHGWYHAAFFHIRNICDVVKISLFSFGEISDAMNISDGIIDFIFSIFHSINFKKLFLFSVLFANESDSNIKFFDGKINKQNSNNNFWRITNAKKFFKQFSQFHCNE